MTVQLSAKAYYNINKSWQKAYYTRISAV